MQKTFISTIDNLFLAFFSLKISIITNCDFFILEIILSRVFNRYSLQWRISRYVFYINWAFSYHCFKKPNVVNSSVTKDRVKIYTIQFYSVYDSIATFNNLTKWSIARNVNVSHKFQSKEITLFLISIIQVYM